ncbi:MAG: hypothetical protein HC945_02025, partial [Nitrosarchaeum sp.]|nr:hypothetical protein [Nitrosarchaeum sp.]
MPATTTQVALGLNRGQLGAATFTNAETLCWVAIQGGGVYGNITSINWSSERSGTTIDRWADTNGVNLYNYARAFNQTPAIILLASQFMSGTQGQWAGGAPSSHTATQWAAFVDETTESDRSGNTESVAALSFLYSGSYDSNTAPNVTNLTDPPNGAYLNNATVDLNFTATDDQATLFNCSLYTDFTGSWLRNQTLADVAKGTEINFTKTLPDGTYTWNVLCSDAFLLTDWYDANRTFTIDTTTPAITNISATSVTDITAVINWKTDENANSSVNYGLNTALGEFSINSILVTIHGVLLSGLNATTLYYYNVTSCDTAGNCATEGPYNFTTTDEPDSAAPLIQNVTADPYETNATISWDTDESSNSTILYGTSPTGLTNQATNINYVQEHILTLSNLTPLVQYFYNVTSCDPLGNCNSSSTYNFTTYDLTPPSVTLTQPGSGATHEGLTVDLTFRVADNVAGSIPNCTLYTNASGTWQANGTQTNLIQDQHYIFTRTFERGTYLWNVACQDSQGLMGWDTNRSFTVTDLPVTVTLISPEDEG